MKTRKLTDFILEVGDVVTAKGWRGQYIVKTVASSRDREEYRYGCDPYPNDRPAPHDINPNDLPDHWFSREMLALVDDVDDPEGYDPTDEIPSGDYRIGGELVGL
jgi:hypothetical protein